MASRNWYLIKAVMFRLSVVLALASWTAVAILALEQRNNPEATKELGGNLAEVCFVGS
ncbi:MAG TPA: hypothetical protein VKP30_20865 [Polyangiaceae bacterium]|nr:hypothetical protein [Polyangiaceae bacterium]